jgi:hypothetical protein
VNSCEISGGEGGIRAEFSTVSSDFPLKSFHHCSVQQHSITSFASGPALAWFQRKANRFKFNWLIDLC